MKTRLSLLAGVALLAAVVAAGDVSAQAPIGSPYQFSRPPISPYFNLFRRDTGGLPSYYQFVRPELQFRRFVETESARAQRLQHEMQVQGQIQGRQRIGAAGDGSSVQLRSGSEGAVPRTAATFMNRSHYYTSPPPVRPGRP